MVVHSCEPQVPLLEAVVEIAEILLRLLRPGESQHMVVELRPGESQHVIVQLRAGISKHVVVVAFCKSKQMAIVVAPFVEPGTKETL